MFGGASNLAVEVDFAFILIFGVSIFFTVGITGFTIWTVFKFNRKKGIPAQQFTHNNTAEVIWTVIPTIIVMIMFWYGWQGFKTMRTVPDDAMEVDVIGRMWEWDFDYGDGKVTKEFVLPINKAVKLNLFSEDVNHSFYIPAFRVKEDVVPGYDNWLWFEATKKGTYDLFCAEYCGLLHSAMIGTVRIVEQDEYNTWLANVEATGNIPDPEGLALAKANSCFACHSLTGTKLVGPSFKGMYGSKKIVIEDGKEVEITVDDAYLTRSIIDPNGQIVKGFNKGLMQSYEGTINEGDIQKIVEYLRTVE